MHEALGVLRKSIDCSFDDLAKRLRRESDGAIDVAGNTVRRWFVDNRIPLHPLLIMLEWSGGVIDPVIVADLYPWTRKYFKEEFFQ